MIYLYNESQIGTFIGNKKGYFLYLKFWYDISLLFLKWVNANGWTLPYGGVSQGSVFYKWVHHNWRLRLALRDDQESFSIEKSRIQETKHFSTNADSNTNNTVDQEYPKTQNFWKTEKIIQNAKTQKRLEICQN